MTSPPSDAHPLPEMAQLQQHLKTLKLHTIHDTVEQAIIDFSTSEQSALCLLLRLFSDEVAALTERRIQRRLKESTLPEPVTLNGFDFGFQPGLDEKLILELATTRFVDRREGVILAGNSGTGKSHIAMALATQACKRGLPVRYTTAADMLSDLYSALADDSLERRLRRYINPALLVIDELGFDRLEQESARNAALFFKVIDGRYKRASTVVTSNIDFEQLGHYLGDPVVTTAIVDRMVYNTTVITIDGPSFRLKQSKEHNARIRGEAPGATSAALNLPSSASVGTDSTESSTTSPGKSRAWPGVRTSK